MLKRTPLQRKTPIKKTSSQLSRKPIKVKKKSQEEILQQKEDIEKMWELFEKHWESKPHKCEACGCNLGSVNNSMFSHHLLAKGLDRYKHLAYELENLMLLCPKHHSSTESGFPPAAVVERTQWVKERYGVL